MSTVDHLSFDKGIYAGKADEALRDREKLQKACQSFEALLLAQIWKHQLAAAKALGPGAGEPFHQMEDVALEMASDQLSRLGGVGLWKFLYEEIAKQGDQTRK